VKVNIKRNTTIIVYENGLCELNESEPMY